MIRDPKVSRESIRTSDRWIASHAKKAWAQAVTPREAMERVRFFEEVVAFHGMDVLAAMLDNDGRRERKARASQDEALGLLATWKDMLAEALAGEVAA